MIIEDMRNTGILGQPEEWFVPWDPSKTQVNWQEAFAGVLKRACGDTGVMAVKVMANQLHNIDACLTEVFPAGPKDDPDQDREFGHFARAFQDAKWVKITRRDTVAQAISRLMAKQTGINHATANPEDAHFAGNLARGYSDDYNKKTVYRYETLLNYVTAIVLENLAWSRFFASHGITPVELIYEDIAKDAEMTHLDAIAGLIGLETEPERQPRTMVKMGNSRNHDWRERFFRDAAANRYLPADFTP
jgi:LPS sulfotransferase NodH